VAWDNPPPIQHLGVYFNTKVQGPWIRAYEARTTPEVEQHIGNVVSTPVTTGAFMGMRRADFEKIGGFDTEFFYGLEDVDLCLKVLFELDKAVATDNSLNIAHHRGFSRSKEGDITVRRRNNNNLLNTRWGNQLRQSAKKDILRNSAFWTGSRPVFGFVVVDAGDETSAGEYFTALELARALQKIHPIHVRFLTKDEWTDLSEIDVLVVMVNGFNLHQVKKASPFLVTINWTRQWFDRWAQDETIHSYDIVFASSQHAADYMHERTGINIDVLPIATDFERFAGGTFDPALASDYCLTGNMVGTKREIEFHLDPDLINGTGAIFGHNWEGTKLGEISRGPIAYSQMAEVYASSKISIDDANIATKAYGSCNSRVFDSIAGGTLLITNGALGVQKLFGDLVPTYTNKEELTKELNYWIANDDAREQRISELQALVKAKHTYDARAAVVSDKLMNQPLKTRISIKCAAPYAERHVWGDTHFANSLAKSLRKQGFTVRVDYRESWNVGIADSDDAVIMLRGIKEYKPKPHQYAIMWLISHPTAVLTSEFDNFDQIFVASKPHADVLAQLTDIPVDVLLQCTDTTLFKFNEDLETASRPTLFVGNSRGIFRPALRWSIEMEAPVDIYGSGWGQFVTDDRLKGTYIPNQVLPSYYQTSQNVLCDHWDDMKRLGYLSNRAFDVLAVGGWLTVDEVEGIEDILDGGYSVFRNKEELAALLQSDIPVDIEDRRKRAVWVAENHSFDARAKTLADIITAGLAARTNPAIKTRLGTLSEVKPR
jgi:spore maturation protein CgeB